MRATSTMRIDPASQPSRVFTVTGRWVADCTRDTTSLMRGRSRSRPAPAPRRATLLTQQPQLMSMRSGPAAVAISAAFSIDSSEAP